MTGHPQGLRFAFEAMAPPDPSLAPLAWGGLRAWVGDTLVWSHQPTDAVTSEGQPVAWSWVELLDGLARIWPWLVLEEGYPLPVSPEHPGLLEQEASTRWEGLAEGEREAEEDVLFDFHHRHDLSLLPRGIFLPALWLIREGREYVIWSDALPYPVRRPFAEVLDCLSALGDRLSAEADSRNARAERAVHRWNNRAAAMQSRFFELASGLSREELAALVGQSSVDQQSLTAFFDAPAANEADPACLASGSEILAAARMTAGYLDIADQRTALAAIRRLPLCRVPELELLSQRAPALDPVNKGYEQGYELALWLRAEIGLAPDDVADPEVLLQAWGVELREERLDPSLDALAAWGERHGPGIVLNCHPHAWTSNRNRRRTTLAHEICHLLVDRYRSLPLVEVLGGQAPRQAEQRANAFAAEFLLPRDTAVEVCRRHADLLDAARDLELHFQVSREVVRHQINNSSLGDALTRMDRTRLAHWSDRRQQAERGS